MRKPVYVILALVVVLGLFFVLRKGPEPSEPQPKGAIQTKLTRTPSEPRPPATKPERATVLLPDYAGKIYIDGKPVSGETEVTSGDVVISAFDGENYVHETLRLKEGDRTPVIFNPQPETPPKGWSSFQGDKLRRGYTDARDRETLEVQWQLEFGQKVRSSPIIVEHTAYFSGDNATVIAVDLEAGKLLWQRGRQGSALTPVIANRFVFACTDEGLLEAYALPNGEAQGELALASSASSLGMSPGEALLASTGAGQVQSIKTRKTFSGSVPMKAYWTRAFEASETVSAPLFLDKSAVYNTRVGLVAISLENGEMLWPEPGSARSRAATARSVPAYRQSGERLFLMPTPASDGAVIYTSIPNGVAAFSINGDPLWQSKLKETVTSSLSLAHGFLYFGTDAGNLYILSIRNPEERLMVNLGAQPIFASPVLFADKLLALSGEGTLVLLHAFTGERLAESQALGAGPVYATPAVTDDHLIAISGNGRMVGYR